MAVTAKLRYLRIAPRKVRLVTDLIRGKKISEALTILQFATKRAALPLQKLLKQAIANAKHNFGFEENNLYISKITVDEGPKLKRWMPRARGRASEIQKKTSHISLILDTLQPAVKTPAAQQKKKKIKKKREVPKREKPIQKKPEIKISKPKIEKLKTRIFRRKAF